MLAGLALQDAPEFSAAWIQPFGTLFLNLVKMLVVPLVFCSLTAGVGGLGDARHMGRVGGRTLLFYLCTTALAVALGLLSANLFPVGRGLGYPLPAAREEAPSFSLADTLLGIVPTNPIQALAEGNMLQIDPVLRADGQRGIGAAWTVGHPTHTEAHTVSNLERRCCRCPAYQSCWKNSVRLVSVFIQTRILFYPQIRNIFRISVAKYSDNNTFLSVSICCRYNVS